MTVSNGQLANATNFNAAFMSRTSDTSTTGAVTVSNTTQSSSKDTGSIITEGGIGVEKNAYVGGNLVVTGTAGASNLSGTNTGDVTLNAVGSSPNGNGASLSGQSLTLQSADDSFPGLLTAAAQNIGGVKTFKDTTQSSSKDTGCVILEGGLGVEKNAYIGGDLVATGTAGASNLSGTNTGDVTLTTIGSTPNGNGASLSGQQLQLQPADATYGGVVSATTQTFAGNKTFTGNLIFQAALQGDVTTDSSTTGAGATLPAPAKGILRVTNASLTSITMISGASASQIFVLINKVGGTITVTNEAGGTASYRILTGTGADITMPDNSALIFAYDSTATRWQVIGSTSTGVGFTNPMDSAGDMIIGGVGGAATKLDHPGTDNRVVRSTGASSTGFGQIDNTAFFTTGAAASASNIGIVTTSAQNFAGAKTFNDGVIFDEAAGQSTCNFFKEDSFTPTIEGGVSNPSAVTYSVQSGRYSRIGNFVFYSIYVAWSSVTGGSGELRLADLPYTSQATMYWPATVWCNELNAQGTDQTHFMGIVAPNTTKVRIQSTKDNGASTSVLITDNTAGNLVVQGFYSV